MFGQTGTVDTRGSRIAWSGGSSWHLTSRTDADGSVQMLVPCMHCRREGHGAGAGSIAWTVSANKSSQQREMRNLPWKPNSGAFSRVGPTIVSRHESQLRALLARGKGIMQRIRSYLQAVYPAARLKDDTLPDSDVAAFFLTRFWFYHVPSAPSVPFDALSPHLFPHGCKGGHGCRRAVQCAQGGALRGMLHISRRLAHRELVPCSWVGCVHNLSRYRPAWASGLEAQGGYVEVSHFSYAAFQAGLNGGRWQPWTRQKEGPPHLWSDALDWQLQGKDGSGWWYLFTPGSGLFYHLGAVIVAPSKTAMLMRLLERLATRLERHARARTRGFDELLVKLRKLTGHELQDFLERLRTVESGAKTCAEAGVPRCYSEGVQYTIMDDYDEFMLSLGRALGLDSLFYTASFLRPLPNYVAAAAEGEIVDLRQPEAALRDPAAWAALSPEAKAKASLAEAQARGAISLRDPFRSGGPEGAPLPCNFSVEPTNRLSCKGHVSWDVRDRIFEDRFGECEIPVDAPRGAAPACAE